VVEQRTPQHITYLIDFLKSPEVNLKNCPQICPQLAPDTLAPHPVAASIRIALRFNQRQRNFWRLSGDNGPHLVVIDRPSDDGVKKTGAKVHKAELLERVVL
jgi:hypothetical protein